MGERVFVRRWTRAWLLTCLLFVSFTLLVLVLASPLALSALDTGDRDWRRLSEIGQTYGAVSTLISILTLGGITVSLLLQSRSARLDHEQVPRTIHMELMKMALEDPELLACWGGAATGEVVPTQRQSIYINLVVSFWEMNLEVGRSEAQVKLAADGLFSGPLGREFWRTNRLVREADTKPKQQLHRLLDERWQIANRREEAKKLASAVHSERSGHEAGEEKLDPSEDEVESAPQA